MSKKNRGQAPLDFKIDWQEKTRPEGVGLHARQMTRAEFDKKSGLTFHGNPGDNLPVDECQDLSGHSLHSCCSGYQRYAKRWRTAVMTWGRVVLVNCLTINFGTKPPVSVTTR